jgi:outer membrane lipoprotein-sorting protein
MKKQTALLILCGTLVCILLFSGCSSNKPAASESIQDILAKAQTIHSVKYNVTIILAQGNGTANNRTLTVWEKPPYMKINSSMGDRYQVFIVRPEGLYIGIEGSDKFSKINGSSPEPSLMTQSEILRSNISFRIVGNETVNGVATTVLQYSTTTSGGTTTTKVWIWNDKGIPIKTQETVVMGEMTFVTTKVMNNFDFSNIPDSEFDLS